MYMQYEEIDEKTAQGILRASRVSHCGGHVIGPT